MARSGFTRLVHADWSTRDSGRWFVEARQASSGWLVQAPQPVGRVDNFVGSLVNGPQPTLAGFDFPIGLPAAFGAQAGFGGFREAVDAFGAKEWSAFYDVCDRAEDISPHRPFYPRVSSAAARQAHLVRALRADSINDLLRHCDRATADRGPACAMFWTLGAKQVGKAAISGWQGVVQPARRAGALLWPFDGTLADLAGAGRLVVCETYPAEAYGHVGVGFSSGKSKKSQADRRCATEGLASRCARHGIQLSGVMRDMLADGFGPGKQADDPFDAAIGLLGMIEVVEGRRAEAPATLPAAAWEGWILGQAA